MAAGDFLPGLNMSQPGSDEKPTPPRRKPAIGVELIRSDPQQARKIVDAYLNTGMSLNTIAREFLVSRDVVTAIVQGALSTMKPDERARALFYRESAIKSKLVETTLNFLDDKDKLAGLSISAAVDLVTKLTQPAAADGPDRKTVGQLQPAGGEWLDIIDADFEESDGFTSEKKDSGAPDSVDAEPSQIATDSVQQSNGLSICTGNQEGVAVSVATDAQPDAIADADNAPAHGGGGVGAGARATPKP